DGPGGGVCSRKSHARLRLAVAGLMISAVILGGAVVGTVLWQGDRSVPGKMAPTQGEPEVVADNETEPQRGTADRQNKVVVQEDRTPDAEQLDNGLDELERAEAAAARGQWSVAARAYARITMDPPVPLDAWYHRAIACLKTGDQAGYREICESMLDRVKL